MTRIWVAPKGESDQARALRIRQYEDFFNVSGMGTPDDLEEPDSDFGFVHRQRTNDADLGGELIHQIDVGVQAQDLTTATCCCGPGR
jgi:phenylpropionate dioxygenase-like ring-hydroxylating dioxygenase large terminal subunit